MTRRTILSLLIGGAIGGIAGHYAFARYFGPPKPGEVRTWHDPGSDGFGGRPRAAQCTRHKVGLPGGDTLFVAHTPGMDNCEFCHPGPSVRCPRCSGPAHWTYPADYKKSEYDDLPEILCRKCGWVNH